MVAQSSGMFPATGRRRRRIRRPTSLPQSNCLGVKFAAVKKSAGPDADGKLFRRFPAERFEETCLSLSLSLQGGNYLGLGVTPKDFVIGLRCHRCFAGNFHTKTSNGLRTLSASACK